MGRRGRNSWGTLFCKKGVPQVPLPKNSHILLNDRLPLKAEPYHLAWITAPTGMAVRTPARK